MVLRETIEEYLFGDRPTSELSSQAFDVKTSNFGEKNFPSSTSNTFSLFLNMTVK